MRLYLSSYNVGDHGDRLAEMARGRTLGFVPNALDFVEESAAAESHARCVAQIADLGIRHETLDLRAYFGRGPDLRRKLRELGGLWVRGGNTFVLRQAMRRSGFDDAIRAVDDPDFLWAGYSAGICVLAPSLDGLQHVDDPTQMPYGPGDVVHDGLGLLDYLILPHYRSDHFESEAVEGEVEYCLAQGIPFRTLRDGEVLVGVADAGARTRLDLLPRG